MPDDRYEIRGKIGQGGVGAVYRAFDQRLNREVAIKRVLPEGGHTDQEEAVENLLKEATSLSSVQHPHIVTIFDAGLDEDGPYVVMELLEGRTIDEMIEKGSLLLEDFREVAVQTQEALIAAQDLNLVHRDLKPTNVMVTWLPSGKFQIKLVDFGLAKFHPTPSVQTIDHGDAVFGSIHFMAPEQFERTPLDQRTDMYALGCVYYFCLTGLYPFNGENGPEVMSAHLNHQVASLAEMRPDLPEWVCSWVMWHIERKMEDRPADAREALKRFLECEETGVPVASAAAAPPPQTGKPRLLIPGAQAEQVVTPHPATPPTGAVAMGAPRHPTTGVVQTKSAPQPLQPPPGDRPSVHTTSQVTVSAPPPEEEESQEAVAEAPAPQEPPTVQLRTANPGAAAAAPRATKINLKNPTAPPLTPARPPETAAQAPPATPGGGAAAPETPATPEFPAKPRHGLGKGAKIAIVSILVVLIGIVGALVATKLGAQKSADRISALLAKGEDVKLNQEEAKLLLQRAIAVGADNERPAIYLCLRNAESSDGSDLDETIARYAASPSIPMADELRSRLFKVLAAREPSPAAIALLIGYANQTDDPRLATDALSAARTAATDDYLGDLIRIISINPNTGVQYAAESALAELASRTENKSVFINELLKAFEGAPTPEARHSYLRLLGTAGGNRAGKLLREIFEADNEADLLAAIKAIESWPDDSMFPDLLALIAKHRANPKVRAQALNSARKFLAQPTERSADESAAMWTSLWELARTRQEKLDVVNALARTRSAWALPILQKIEKDPDEDVSYRALKAIEHVEEQLKLLEDSP